MDWSFIENPRIISALYVETDGVYFHLPGVDPWDEHRNAKKYDGPYPVIAHPPCGPWGPLSPFCTKQDKTCGPIAVSQVQKYGGILEHPAGSKLWKECNLPRPYKSKDAHGGFTLPIQQVGFGHCAVKPTWLYIVGIPHADSSVLSHFNSWLRPTHQINTFGRGVLPEAKKSKRNPTPIKLAKWLVKMARECQIGLS